MNSRRFIAAALVLFLCVPCALANEPLQGGVEETGVAPAPRTQEIMDMPTPVLPEVPLKPQKGSLEESALKGNVKQNELNGEVDDEGDPSLMNGTAQPDSGRQTLQGRAELGDNQLAGDDPDMDDAELQVAWDKWRNRLLSAIQSGVQETLSNPEEQDLRFDPGTGMVRIRFPVGTTTWFFCKINNKRHIEIASITKESKFPNYNRAVLEAVKNLEGGSILQFPKRSRRLFVTQSAGIKTSDSASKQFFNFGDVERYRQGGN